MVRTCTSLTPSEPHDDPACQSPGSLRRLRPSRCPHLLFVASSFRLRDGGSRASNPLLMTSPPVLVTAISKDSTYLPAP